MVSLTVYSVVIFSHRYLDSDCINFRTFFIPGCLLVHLNIIIQLRHQSSTIFYSGSLKMLNNVFKKSFQDPLTCLMITLISPLPFPGGTNLPLQRQHELHHPMLPVSMAAGQPLVAPMPPIMGFAPHQAGPGGSVSTAQPINPSSVIGQQQHMPFVLQQKVSESINYMY